MCEFAFVSVCAVVIFITHFSSNGALRNVPRGRSSQPEPAPTGNGCCCCPNKHALRVKRPLELTQFVVDAFIKRPHPYISLRPNIVYGRLHRRLRRPTRFSPFPISLLCQKEQKRLENFIDDGLEQQFPAWGVIKRKQQPSQLLERACKTLCVYILICSAAQTTIQRGWGHYFAGTTSTAMRTRAAS